MKINLLFVAVMLCFGAGACKKGGEAKKQIKLLTKITKVSDGRTTVINVKYDDKNRLIDNGSYTFTYDGNDLVKIGQGDAIQTVTYTNGVPASLNVKAANYTQSFTYNVLNERINKRNAVTFGLASYQFTYSGNNLISELTSSTSGTTYIYGLDKGPYYNSRLKYVFNPNTAELFSENEITEWYYQYSPRLGATYSYLRDAEGYPKSAVEKRNKVNDPDAFIYTDITYEYEMRDVAE